MFKKKSSSRNKESHGESRFSTSDLKCKIHPMQGFSLFCSTCDVLVCTECLITEHNGHIYSKIQEVSQRKTQDLVHSLQDMRDFHIPVLRTKVREIEDCKLHNQTTGNDRVAQINSRFNKLVYDLQKVRDRFVVDIKNSQSNNEKRLNVFHLELVKELTKLEGIYSDFSSILKTGSDVQKIAAQHIVTSALDKVHTGHVNTTLGFPTFHEGAADSAVLQNMLGILEPEENLASDFESSSLNDKYDVKFVSKIQHKQADITAICPIGDDLAWVHGSDYTENEIINLAGNVKNCVEFGFMVIDIDKTSNNCLYAGDHENSRISKLAYDGSSQKNIDTSPWKPLGLCVAKNQDILVCLVDSPSYFIDMRSRRLVARLDKNGKFIETYEYNEISRLFTKPLRVTENGNLDICVINRTSSSTGQLVVLNDEGQYKVTYEGFQSNEFNPLDVKCDYKENIILSDGTRRIHLLDKTAKFVQYLLTETDLMERPWSLAVDSRRRIWIGCDDGKIYVIRLL